MDDNGDNDETSDEDTNDTSAYNLTKNVQVNVERLVIDGGHDIEENDVIDNFVIFFNQADGSARVSLTKTTSAAHR